MLGYIFFTFWRLFEIVTLIPTLGMLVSSDAIVLQSITCLYSSTLGILRQYQPESQSTQSSLYLVSAPYPPLPPKKQQIWYVILTYPSCRTLFIVSTLAAVWAIVTLFRRKSTQRSTLYVAFVDLCFVGAFIAGVYELRGIGNANCSSFSNSSPTYLSVGTNGISGSSGISANIQKDCEMQKASFAFGIMNCIFFFITFMILLFMHRTRDDDNVQYKTEVTRKRRSHDSRYAMTISTSVFLFFY